MARASVWFPTLNIITHFQHPHHDHQQLPASASNTWSDIDKLSTHKKKKNK